MATARSEQIDLDVTTYYFCTCRCVRRAYLYGEDKETGKNYDHRKEWLVKRMEFLANIFAMQICAYSVLDNHYHLVLGVLVDDAAAWSADEVIRRAGLLCPGQVKGIEKWTDEIRETFVATWRERLIDVSWFMGRLNEYVARRANQEDECTGKFWEARFRCQALLDEAALLACMSYVDLNPVRAGLAEGLDGWDWTSIWQRLQEAPEASKMAAAAKAVAGPEDSPEAPAEQTPEIHESVSSAPAEEQSDDAPTPAHVPDSTESEPTCEQLEGQTNAADGEQEEAAASTSQDAAPSAPGLKSRPPLALFDADGLGFPIPMTLEQYIALLEETGRQVREGAKGRITGPPSELIAKLGLDPDAWLDAVQRFQSFGLFIGHPTKLQERASARGKRRVRGRKQMATLYRSAA